MHMRPSRVLKKLRAGEVASCVKINLSCPRVIELAGIKGFDCVWIDNEHVPTDWLMAEHLIRAAKVHDMDTVCRVARGSYSDYVRPLEADAAGIMVPHLMSADDARKVIRLTRFHPLGLRPVDGGNVDSGYTNVDFKEYIQTANRERFVIVQIEDPEPMAELDQIVALEGIDMVFFGPGDFSQGIGNPGDFNDPRIEETRRKIARVASEHGKIAGTAGNLSNMSQLIDMGYRFISVGADVVGLSAYFAEIAAAFKDLKD